MNAQDREDLKDLSKKIDTVKDDIFHLGLQIKDGFNVASLNEQAIVGVKEDLRETKGKVATLEKGERKTILIASIVGSVVTGGGALILWYITAFVI